MGPDTAERSTTVESVGEPQPSERAELRQTMRTLRRSLAPELQDERAHAVANRTLDLLDLLDPGAPGRPLRVGATVADDGELDPGPLVDALRARGAHVVYPRVADGSMTFACVDGPQAFVPGPGGVLQPGATAASLAPRDLDVVLVPVVAFDARCERLGRGGGHYDRSFAGRAGPPPLLVGLGHDEQLVADVGAASHDVALDHVVTPTRVHSRIAD